LPVFILVRLWYNAKARGEIKEPVMKGIQRGARKGKAEERKKAEETVYVFIG